MATHLVLLDVDHPAHWSVMVGRNGANTGTLEEPESREAAETYLLFSNNFPALIVPGVENARREGVACEHCIKGLIRATLSPSGCALEKSSYRENVHLLRVLWRFVVPSLVVRRVLLV